MKNSKLTSTDILINNNLLLSDNIQKLLHVMFHNNIWQNFTASNLSVAIGKMAFFYNINIDVRNNDLSFLYSNDGFSCFYREQIYKKIKSFVHVFKNNEIANIILSLAILGVDSNNTAVRSLAYEIYLRSFSDTHENIKSLIAKDISNTIWGLATLGGNRNIYVILPLLNELTRRFLTNNNILKNFNFLQLSEIIRALAKIDIKQYIDNNDILLLIKNELSRTIRLIDYSKLQLFAYQDVVEIMWSLICFNMLEAQDAVIYLDLISMLLENTSDNNFNYQDQNMHKIIIIYYYCKLLFKELPEETFLMFDNFVKKHEEIVASHKEPGFYRFFYEHIEELMFFSCHCNQFKVAIEYDKYLYGYFIDGYFVSNGKEYVIEINGSIHEYNCQDVDLTNHNLLKEKIFNAAGVTVIYVDFAGHKLSLLNYLQEQQLSNIQKNVTTTVSESQKALYALQVYYMINKYYFPDNRTEKKLFKISEKDNKHNKKSYNRISLRNCGI